MHYLPLFRNCLPDDQVFAPGHFRSLDPAHFVAEDRSDQPSKNKLCQVYTGVREEEVRYWSPLLTKVVASVDLSGEYARVVRLNLADPALSHINMFGMVIPRESAHNNKVHGEGQSIVDSLRVGASFAHPLEANYMASQFLRISVLTMNAELPQWHLFEFYQADDENVPSVHAIGLDTQGIEDYLGNSYIFAAPTENDEKCLYTPDGLTFGPYEWGTTDDEIREIAFASFCEYHDWTFHKLLVTQAQQPLSDLAKKYMDTYTELWLGLVDQL